MYETSDELLVRKDKGKLILCTAARLCEKVSSTGAFKHWLGFACVISNTDWPLGSFAWAATNGGEERQVYSPTTAINDVILVIIKLKRWETSHVANTSSAHTIKVFS
jgi:hypothetical protein